MELNEFIKKLRAKNVMPQPHNKQKAVEAALAIQIHTTGARPMYEVNGIRVVPETYEKRFDTLFKQRLLNRHPNESPSHYNWRLSVYSPVAKELYDKFMNLCKGSILQPNNYSITCDALTDNYLKSYRLNHEIEEMLEFVMENPYGFISVINDRDVDESQVAGPVIHYVKYEDVLMYDEESIAYQYEEGQIVFINEFEHSIINLRKNIVKTYPHNFERLPVWKYRNSFLQPYQNWSDLLVRNMNDDEAMVKHYSYPKLQIVESSCPQCQGSGRTPNDEIPYDPTRPDSNLMDCKRCTGKGTISRNPGDFITVSEETIVRNNGQMHDYAKFITPDVGIPEYHLKRWQVFYDRVEQSLYLRQATTAAQSGEAKKEDRKDQYVFLQSISNFVFENVTKCVQFMSQYLNNSTTPSTEISVTFPKQFDIMSDSDVVNELADLQNKTDDSQTLSELNHLVNSKIFRDDPVQRKISEVLYYADPLYGISGNALKMKYLSGAFTTEDKIVHEKGYKLLLLMSKSMTPQVFVDTDTSVLMDRLKQEISILVPTDIYSNNFQQEPNALKDSVGGLTGMIEIAKAVASGLYDLDAAVALVSDRFGVTEEEARRQLGTPTISNPTQLEQVVTLT